MNLPPVPEPVGPDSYKKYTREQLKAYGEACIKHVCGGKHPKKFTHAEVQHIRSLHDRGQGYKFVNRHYPMAEKTFYNVVNKKGAYK